MSEVAAPSKEDKKKGPEKWEIENWARTVIEAEEIKSDPEKMKHVKPELDKKSKGLQAAVRSIADLKKLANGEKLEEKSEDEE